jgi:hypothetical protein
MSPPRLLAGYVAPGALGQSWPPCTPSHRHAQPGWAGQPRRRAAPLQPRPTSTARHPQHQAGMKRTSRKNAGAWPNEGQLKPPALPHRQPAAALPAHLLICQCSHRQSTHQPSCPPHRFLLCSQGHAVRVPDGLHDGTGEAGRHAAASMARCGRVRPRGRSVGSPTRSVGALDCQHRSRCRRLRKGEEGDEAFDCRDRPFDLHLTGLQRIGEVTVPVDQCRQCARIGFDGGVGPIGLATGELQPAVGDPNAEAVVADPQGYVRAKDGKVAAGCRVDDWWDPSR